MQRCRLSRGIRHLIFLHLFACDSCRCPPHAWHPVLHVQSVSAHPSCHAHMHVRGGYILCAHMQSVVAAEILLVTIAQQCCLLNANSQVHVTWVPFTIHFPSSVVHCLTSSALPKVPTWHSVAHTTAKGCGHHPGHQDNKHWACPVPRMPKCC